MRQGDTEEAIGRYILELGKEVQIMSGPINPLDYEDGTWLFCIYPKERYLFVLETYIDSATRNMNAKRWDFKDLDELPNELKIYNLLTS